MIEFFVYEQNEVFNNNIRNDIYKFIGSRIDNFKIYNYDKSLNNSKNFKIYILSSNNINETYKIAEEIRNNGDFISQIIIISNIHKKNLINDLLILSYIDYSSYNDNKLIDTLETAYDIITKSSSFTFTYNKNIYRVPLKDILYIEKENNSNKSIIYTKTKQYFINSTIKDIDKRINYVKFMKTHRSCIVNLDNIRMYDYTNNIIYFKDKQIDLVSRDKRAILKEKILDNIIQ